MRLLWVCMSLAALAAAASPVSQGEVRGGSVQTIGAVHVIALPAKAGVVRLYVASDAAAGDTISGVIFVQPGDPVGNDTPSSDTSGDGLGRHVVELNDQRTPLAAGQFEWVVPRNLRVRAATVVLRDGEGQAVSQVSLPLDPVPAPQRPASAGVQYELPTEGQSGWAASVRGPTDGRLTGKAVTLGEAPLALLAASPRQLAFLVPPAPPGVSGMRLLIDGQVAGGPADFRTFRVEANVPVLAPGQRGTLTVAVLGLGGISQPVTLAMRNQSPTIFRVENIERPITIDPGRVTRDGRSVVTRRITGLTRGTGRILATVGSRPLFQFALPGATDRSLDDWEEKTGVAITPDAAAQIHRSIAAARGRLDEFLAIQQANNGDVQAVFAALLSHYCFDLRDDALAQRPQADAWPAGPRLLLASWRAPAAADVAITPREVKKLSFSEFLADLVSRFTSARQAVGYLFVSSTPPRAPIALDGERKGQVTNRRFVTPVGDHLVVVEGYQPCRQPVTITAFQTQVVDCAP